MGTYPIRILVHGAPVDTHLACPFDGLTDLQFPAYRNKINASGLVQPYGPIGDDALVHMSGIVRPNWNPDPTGYFRAAPSGLTRVHNHAWANDGYNGVDKVTNYDDINYYQAYWTCPSGHFFIFPSGVSADLPGGAYSGNRSNSVPTSWGQFE